MPGHAGGKAGSLATVLVVLAAVVAAGWLLRDRSGRPTDFSQDYFAAEVLLDGGSIYGDEVAQRGRAWFGDPSPANFHPPALTLSLLPLAWLPYRWAFALLGVLSTFLFVWSLDRAARATSIGGGRRRLLLAGLLWWPFWACLSHGQVSMAVAAALVASWLCDERGRSGMAGALVGVATLLKLFPALVGLYFLLRRDGRAVAAMALVVVAGMAASWAAVGSDDFVRYWTEVMPESSARWSSHPLNVSLHGALQGSLGDPSWGTEPLIRAPAAARMLALLLGAAMLTATVARGVRLLEHGRRGARRLFASLCVAALLLSPLTWSHTLAAALLPLVVVFAERKPGWSWWSALIVAFLLIGFPGPPLGQLLGPLFAGGPIPWVVAALFQAPMIGLVILWWRLTFAGVK